MIAMLQQNLTLQNRVVIYRNIGLTSSYPLSAENPISRPRSTCSAGRTTPTTQQ